MAFNTTPTLSIDIVSGTNPVPQGGSLTLRASVRGGLYANSYTQFEWTVNGVSMPGITGFGVNNTISVPTDKDGTVQVVAKSMTSPLSLTANYSYKIGTPATPPPPAPAPKPETTSISISVDTSAPTYPHIKRTYKINENIPTATYIGWYVNDVRTSTGTQFNFSGNAGERIYAIVNPPVGQANGNTLTGYVRSNTIIYNSSGADGAGASGTTPPPKPDPVPNSGDIDGDGVPDTDDKDIDGDGINNEDDDDIDGDGVHNEEDDTPSGNAVAQIASYDTLYTRASQAQYLGDVFHADPTHTNPAPAKAEGFSLPTPLLIMVGLAGGYFIYTNSKR